MKRKRSRRDTELRFQTAVLEIIAESGCAELGINLIAQKAGSDKVLIYRYFENLEGLLKSVAESRPWVLDAEQMVQSVPTEPSMIVRALFDEITDYFQQDPAAQQLMRWADATDNPLTSSFKSQWQTFWHDIEQELVNGLSYPEGKKWKSCCALLSLIIKEELVGGGAEWSLLEPLCEQLSSPNGFTDDLIEEPEATLPTNLL